MNDFLFHSDWNSALFIILNGTKEEHLDMLDGGIIQRLLEEKWKTFARVCFDTILRFFEILIIFLLQNQFLKRLLILFVHLFFLSISVYLRPATENLQNKEYEESRTDRVPNTDGTSDGNGDSDETEDDSMNVTNVIRYFSEVATLVGVLSYVIFQQGDEIKNQGLPAFLKQLVSLSCFHSFLMILSANMTFNIKCIFIGKCASKSNIFNLKLYDFGVYSISNDG